VTSVGYIAELVTARRAQGWAQNTTVAQGNRVQLVEAHCAEPSVVSVTVSPQPGKSGALGDVAGDIVIETRIGEAVRTRRFPTRFAGVSTNVPSGITRVFYECLTAGADVRISTQIAPGIATIEHVAKWVSVPATGTLDVEPIPFARTVTVGPVNAQITVASPLGGAAIDVFTSPGGGSKTVTVAALATLTLANANPNAAAVSLSYEVTS